MNVFKHDPEMPDEDVTLEYILSKLCIIGTKDECIRRLQELYEETGGFGTLLMIAHDWGRQGEVAGLHGDAGQ